MIEVTALSACSVDDDGVRTRAAKSRHRRRSEILCSLLLVALAAPLPTRNPCGSAYSANCCDTTCAVATATRSASVDCCVSTMRAKQTSAFVLSYGGNEIRAALAMDQIQAFLSPAAVRAAGLTATGRFEPPALLPLSPLVQTRLLLI